MSLFSKLTAATPSLEDRLNGAAVTAEAALYDLTKAVDDLEAASEAAEEVTVIAQEEIDRLTWVKAHAETQAASYKDRANAILKVLLPKI